MREPADDFREAAAYPFTNASPEAQRIRLRFAADAHCHAGRDGECCWDECPQEANGRREYLSFCCPLAREYPEF